MPGSRRSWRSCSRLYSASASAASVLRRVRPGRHSNRKRRLHSHWAGSARGRKRSGASSRPSHCRILDGAVGLAHGSQWLTEICPPLAKLVSSAASGCRSTTITSWPVRARYHALVVPITPAPRTTTLMPASDTKKGGKLALYPPILLPERCDPAFEDRPLGDALVTQSPGLRFPRGNQSTLLTFSGQGNFCRAF